MFFFLFILAVLIIIAMSSGFSWKRMMRKTFRVGGGKPINSGEKKKGVDVDDGETTDDESAEELSFSASESDV
jgi:UPF0716 family protein affecting phage T7 exclusion